MNSTVIVGGTGTLGKEICRQLLSENESAMITVFSRDELKQQEMKREFPFVRYFIGDIRDRDSLSRAFRGAGTIFHCAALKHVDVVEENPMEAVKTNVIGTQNVIDAAIAARARRVIFSSTDKAVAPINVYGHTKAIGERLILGSNCADLSTHPKFSVFRWGNVVGSRGSVIHAFAKSLREEGKIRLTEADMSRFWIRIECAVRFMVENSQISTGKVMIPPMKAASVLRFAAVVAGLVGVKNYEIEITGKRPGEKIHETVTEGLSSDHAPQYSDAELVDLIQPILNFLAAA